MSITMHMSIIDIVANIIVIIGLIVAVVGLKIIRRRMYSETFSISEIDRSASDTLAIEDNEVLDEISADLNKDYNLFLEDTEGDIDEI